ncbi:type VI secretion system protein TssA [Thalassotalea euphylliae]|uniref:Type VI secretion system protein TssA n=1 Tax=Thalassotalea euphylliae TaxID=1655234 RepID=A0A3E0TT79_9GAMM|nr:type VI secretion system protein TssA [Thalassotalea euphylliae]REL27679.1 type VI secretion system protein TssA [Thalassotalea euphylliae]
MDYYSAVTRSIEESSPCGISLEDDHGLEALFFKAEGTPERYDGQKTIPAEPPNWRELETNTLAYLEQSKDINIIVLLSQIALNTRGLSAFSDCIRGLSQVVTNYWQELFPELDPDDGDATERISALGNLLHTDKTIKPLRQTALASSKVFGAISLLDIEIVQGFSTAPNDRELTEQQLAAIFKDTDQEALQLLNSQVQLCSDSLADLHSHLEEKVGVGQGVNFAPITDLLRKMQSAFNQYSDSIDNNENSHEQAQELADGGEPSTSALANAEAAAVTGEIQGRADVEKALDKICDYFRKHEPSSPVPLLLNRAKQLVHKDFLEIIEDLAPDGAEQVKKLSGID